MGQWREPVGDNVLPRCSGWRPRVPSTKEPGNESGAAAPHATQATQTLAGEAHAAPPLVHARLPQPHSGNPGRCLGAPEPALGFQAPLTTEVPRQIPQRKQGQGAP